MRAPAPFGLLLRHFRRRAGLTQGELAAALGYSDSLISGANDPEQRPIPPIVQPIPLHSPAEYPLCPSN